MKYTSFKFELHTIFHDLTIDMSNPFLRLLGSVANSEGYMGTF